jgi:uncharacterized protein YdhG (YjbR/CyaY superfamily)
MKNTKGVESIDEYISGFPANVQEKLIEIRETIKRAAPGAREKISYQMPTLELNGNLVHFAAYPNHLGFYPAPSGINAFKNELTGFKNSKGAIQFPLDKPLPLDLISSIVSFRVKENLEKST